GVRYQPRVFSGTWSDVGTLDVVTGSIDYGDSNSAALVLNGDGTYTAPAHAYTATGTFTAAVTLTDDDGGTGKATTTIEIKEIDVQRDPCCDGNALYIGGTPSSDKIVVNNVLGGVLRLLNNIPPGLKS